MFCGNCGKPVREGAKFCANCGTPVEVPVIDDVFVSSTDNVPAQMESSNTEVESLPVKEEAHTPEGGAAPTESSQPSKEFVPGKELGKFKMMDKRKGTSMMTASLGTGTLYVYENGLHFGSTFGASVGTGLLGAIASAALTISEACDPNAYPLEQIQELRVGKSLGIYNSLVICMKNGDVWSFYHGIPGSKVPKQIVSLVTPYMDKLK